MVLLGGIAHSVAKFSKPIYFKVLEYTVLLMVVVSTVVCILTVLTELAQSVKYFAMATKANQRVKVGAMARSFNSTTFRWQAAQRVLPISPLPLSVLPSLSFSPSLCLSHS